MKPILTRLCTLLFLLAFTPIFSQESTYSLLWKIEKGEGSIPSYLFGTMHVNDARAFNFSDAVMPAIESCKNFALETHPDSTLIAFREKMKAQSNFDYLKDILTEKELEKLKKRILEVSGRELDSLDIFDINYLTNLLIPEEEKKDDKVTFVDAYLLGQAKTMGKTIKGLESVSSQVDHFELMNKGEQREYVLEYLESDPQSFNDEINELTEIYFTGDIYEIEKTVAAYNGFDFIMEARNEVMCRSIIHLINDGPTFSAVGAAHLPGDKGLISLLRKKGYTVTPVEANFTGVANKYQIDISKGHWYTYTDTDLGYSVEVPGEPYKSNGNDTFQYVEYYELSTGTTYGNYAIDFRVFKIKDYNENINDYINNIEGELVYSKKVRDSNPLQYEFLKKTDENNYFLSHVYMQGDIVYNLVVEDKLSALEENHVTRFFNSIKFSTPKELPKPELVSNEVVNSDGAFKLSMPFEPQKMIREYPNPLDENEAPYLLNVYVATDVKNDRAYVFRYNDQPLGYHLASYEEAFSEAEKTFGTKAKITGEPKTIYLDSIEGREYKMLIQDTYPSICRVFFRGNRTYVILANSETDESLQETLPFFDSFELMPYEKEETVELKLDSTFTLATFPKHKILQDSSGVDSFLDSGKIVNALNTKTGGLYMFTYGNLRRYFKAESKSTFYDEYVESYTGWSDSIVKKEIVVFGDSIEAIDFTVKNLYTKIPNRNRVWLDNGRLYQYSIYSAPEDYNSAFADSILSSYKVKTRVPFDLTASKTDMLLGNLHSKDSLTFAEAHGALYYYSFTEEDLPALYNAVKQDYDDDTDNDEYSAKNLMISVFSNLNDSTTVRHLDSLYSFDNITNTNKIEILNTLRSLEDSTALDSYSKLLFCNPPAIDAYDWQILSPFRDSLALAEKHFKDLLNLGQFKQYRRDLISISSSLAENNSTKNLVNENLSELLKYCEEDVQTFIDKLDGDEGYAYYSLIFNYLDMFQAIKVKDLSIVDNFTSKLVVLKNNQWLVSKSIATRIINDLKIDKSITRAYMDSVSTRFDIMKAYKSSGKFKKIPKKYLTEEAFIKLSTYNNLNADYEEYPDKIDILGTFNQDHEKYSVMKIGYSYDETLYYCVVGPIKPIKEGNDEFKLYPLIFDWDSKTDEELKNDWEQLGRNLLKADE